MRDLVFLANENARMGAAGAQAAKAALEEEGFVVKEFVLSNDQPSFRGHLKQYLEAGEELIAIGGGDGTQRDAVELINGRPTTMMVVPLGTGNAWARELGIPVTPPEMARAYATAEERRIDVGIANGRAFINVATVGLTSLIVKNLEERAKGRFGRIAYLPAVLQSVAQMRPFRIEVQADKHVYSDKVLQFVAAAGRTHAGPFPVTKHAENDDGKLSLYSLHETDHRGLLRFGWALLHGRHTSLDEVWCCETTAATIKTRPRKQVIVDGEQVGRTPLQLSIRPGALKVLVPSDPSEKPAV